MINLFKSANAIVREIHNEIDTAQERLLQQAKDIIQHHQPLENKKAERMAAIGFVNSESVIKHVENKMIVVKNKHQATIIEYYKQNYPFQKFITEGELNRICKKYSLIYKPIENYLKDVPSKNISEIEGAKERLLQDTPEDKLWCEFKRDNSVCLMSGNGGNWCGIWGDEWYRIPKRIDGLHFSSQYHASKYLMNNMNFTTQYLVSEVKNFKQSRQGLFIAAPSSHFEGTDKSISFVLIKPKDPIVFRFVKGGIQVLSKWGIEGEDEALVNEINN